jgi:hypothetical protein
MAHLWMSDGSVPTVRTRFQAFPLLAPRANFCSNFKPMIRPLNFRANTMLYQQLK